MSEVKWVFINSMENQNLMFRLFLYYNTTIITATLFEALKSRSKTGRKYNIQFNMKFHLFYYIHILESDGSTLRRGMFLRNRVSLNVYSGLHE
jgi:hypothetical protein